ncbi:ATP-binding protein [Duncaniella muris]|uniref:sensor histidine kinase n=3 Tax=Duncaniella TaxID=2518495 RepID=UPI000F4958DB|nr:ATP-binding protein [Duncaniella muris]ROS89885.1 hypothetical protein EEL39_03555 [Muribaculaceae bacterium Isolate-080 (Janvier)]
MTTAQTAILTITAILLIAWGAYTAYRYITRTHRRLRMLLEAIESADTSLRFPANSDSEVNATLNRIAQSLSALRIRISETEKYYESITGAVATGVIVITPTGHIILANPAALSLLGRQALTRLSALSDSWSELTRLLDGLPTGLNATVRNLAVKTSAFTRHDGLRLLIVTLDDITRQLEDTSVETWSEMSRVLTHEIMNGIAPVVSIAETLRMRYEGDNDYMTRGLDVISSSTRGLKDFVGNYRRISSLPLPEKSLFDIRPLIEDCISLARAGFSAPTDLYPDTIAPVSPHNPDFIVSLPSVSLTLFADRGQLRQVIVNLIKNAAEAGAALIAIRASIADTSIRIEIENDGHPIPSDIAPRIFTPFFTTRPQGSGIGLSLSRRLVMANGGSLSLSSAPAATPTRFCLTLPAKQS